MKIKYFIFWLPMIFIAFANGTFRQFVLLKYMDSLKAHQLSTVILIILCSIYTVLIFPQLSLYNRKQAFAVGLLWMALTVLFEFTLGRISNKPWDSLLEDYNICKGHIWPVFLCWLLLMPYTIYTLKK
jgi:hypothetical protein